MQAYSTQGEVVLLPSSSHSERSTHGFHYNRKWYGLAGFVFAVCMWLAVAGAYQRWPFPPSHTEPPISCPTGTCTYRVAESIPIGLDIEPLGQPTHESWLSILERAEKTIDIACMYFTLTEEAYQDPVYGQQYGKRVWETLIAKAKAGVRIRIVKALDTLHQFNAANTDYLMSEGLAEVRELDMTRYSSGGVGILHTKFIIVDGSNFYIGSANVDWRSLAQVKELGFTMSACECFADDILKIFQQYWDTAGNDLPAEWPDSAGTAWNSQNPSQVLLNGTVSALYFSVSPPTFLAPGREDDGDAVVETMALAPYGSTVQISVMDYLPYFEYMSPQIYWDKFDTGIRSNSFNNNVRFDLLFSLWNHTADNMLDFANSLNNVPGVTVKIYIVPDQDGVVPPPFTRVNHAKYMVSDYTSWIGTSNWVAGYFLNTAGVSINAHNSGLRRVLTSVFYRDWHSQHAFNIDSLPNNVTEALAYVRRRREAEIGPHMDL